MRHKRELIFICTGSDCKKAGAKGLCKELKESFKKSPMKGNCKLIQTKCLDHCKSAPVVILDDYFYKKTNSDQILNELEKKLK